MRSWWRRPSVIRFLLGVAVGLVSMATAETVSAADGQKQVLVLYSTRRDAQIVVLGETNLPRILDDNQGIGLDYYSEYIDQARFPEAHYDEAFRNFLHLKYRDVNFDVVIAIQDTAVQFVARNRHDLFPNTPVVFFANSPAADRMANSTGIVAGLNFTGTVVLAAALQPELENVFVVTGAAPADKAYERIAQDQLQSHDPRLHVTYLAGLTTRALESRLAALPSRSMIYYVLVDQDGAGENVHPLEYLDRVAAVASAPIYSWVDSAIGHGVVGGSLKDQKNELEALGRLALRVLHGEHADSIPVTSPNLNVDQVDWRELRRWGISEARVPPGALVRFRNPSVWERYRVYILVGVALLAGESTLIVALLIQRTRRHRAEAAMHTSQAALRTSYERIRDLGARLLDAQESERARIARELHDDVSQQVALLAIDLELLGRAVQPTARDMAGEVLERAQGVAKSLYDLSHRLHPAKLRLIGLEAALRGLQREVSQSGMAVTFTPENVPSSLSPELTLCLFRIVQEALQNAVKHSRARHVTVQLRGGPHSLALTVADDGVGFDVERVWGQGLGLVSMSERLESIGGTLNIYSARGSGTRLEATVPVLVVPDSAAVDA